MLKRVTRCNSSKKNRSDYREKSHLTTTPTLPETATSSSKEAIIRSTDLGAVLSGNERDQRGDHEEDRREIDEEGAYTTANLGVSLPPNFPSYFLSHVEGVEPTALIGIPSKP